MIPELPFMDTASLKASQDVPHLTGPAAHVRQVLAAHFVRGIDHIVELGGHPRPITGFLTHTPRSVLMIDPKADPYSAEQLNGSPCRVRHIAAKFQAVDVDVPPRQYALVMIGLSLKPLGSRSVLAERLYGLIDNAAVVVVDYAPALERAALQIPAVLNRPGLTTVCALDLKLEDARIAHSPYAQRRFVVLAAEPGR